MTTYRLTIALAATNDGHMPFGLEEPKLVGTFDEAQRITALFAYNQDLVVEADSVEVALNVAYREANIGENGWAAEYRAARQRSLSVGDVVLVVDESTSRFTVHQVLSYGFGELRLADVQPLLVESPWSFDAADAVMDPEHPLVVARNAR
jgi:hypothetical protein